MARAKGREVPEPHIRVKAATYLLRHWKPDTLPKDRAKALSKALRRNAGAEAATAARLLYLLDKKRGLKLLRKALKDKVPLNRTEAAVSLCLLASADDEARKILATAETPEANYAKAADSGVTIAPVKPTGEMIKHRGRDVTVYSIDEVMAANLPDWVRSELEQAATEYGPLLERW